MYIKDVREANLESKSLFDNKGKTWKPSFSQKMKAWDLYRKGCSDKDIARAIGVSWNQFNQYAVEFARFFTNMKRRRPKDIPKLNRQTVSENNPLLTPQAIKLWAMSGMSKFQISKIVGVSTQTIYNFFNRHPDLQQIFDSFGEIANARVVGALFQRATGMKIKKLKFASHEGKFTDEVQYNEYLPPNVEAAMHWLVNRMKWKKTDGGQLTSNKGAIMEALEQLTQLDDEEIERLDKEHSI